jgi:hypothetical protein
MDTEYDRYTVLPFPRIRQLMVDGGKLGLQKHTIHGLVEFDITTAREKLRHHRALTGSPLSFSAFFLACLGKAVDADRQVQAYRDWRNRLIIFNSVDANMLFEVEVDGQKTIRPHIMRGINRRGMMEIEEEIRHFQAGHASSRESNFIDAFVRLPAFIRRLFLRLLFMNPRLVREYYGTVMVSAIGMFGSGSGWGIPVPNHTLQLTLGGMSRKPGVTGGKIEVRDFISVTVSIDHDVVDGAPAARFIQRLKKLVESGGGLEDARPPADDDGG